MTPIAPPVAWYDDNAGANSRGTLSPFHVRHNDQDGIAINVVPNDVDYDNGPVTIAGHSSAGHGQVTLNTQSGVFTYIPDEPEKGTSLNTYKCRR